MYAHIQYNTLVTYVQYMSPDRTEILQVKSEISNFYFVISFPQYCRGCVAEKYTHTHCSAEYLAEKYTLQNTQRC